MIVKHSSRKHAKLSASGSSRWMNCTPSMRSEEASGIPNTSSDFAKEGTLAHEYSEAELHYKLGSITKRKYTAKIKKIKGHRLYSKEMDKYVSEYVDFVMNMYNEQKRTQGSCEIFIELRVDLTAYVPESFGSCDIVLITPTELTGIDLKYGKGTPVFAQKNPQLRLYALGALAGLDIADTVEKVTTYIHQPRLSSITSETLEKRELLAWAEDEVKPAAEAAFKGEGKQVAGDHCKYCKIKHVCRAHHDIMLEATKMDFAPVETLSDSELVEVYKTSKQLKSWLETVAEHMKSEANAGKKWDGLKLVQGVSRRGWTDTKEVAKVLRRELYDFAEVHTNKLKGIGDISSLMPVDDFEEHLGHLVHKKIGSPFLVPDSDKRPALDIIAELKKDFKD